VAAGGDDRQMAAMKRAVDERTVDADVRGDFLDPAALVDVQPAQLNGVEPPSLGRPRVVDPVRLDRGRGEPRLEVVAVAAEPVGALDDADVERVIEASPQRRARRPRPRRQAPGGPQTEMAWVKRRVAVPGATPAARTSRATREGMGGGPGCPGSGTSST